MKREECKKAVNTFVVEKRYGRGPCDLSKQELYDLESAWYYSSSVRDPYSYPSIYIYCWTSFDKPRFRIRFYKNSYILEKGQIPWTFPAVPIIRTSDVEELIKHVDLDENEKYAVLIGYFRNIFSWADDINLKKKEVEWYIRIHIHKTSEMHMW